MPIEQWGQISILAPLHKNLKGHSPCLSQLVPLPALAFPVRKRDAVVTLSCFGRLCHLRSRDGSSVKWRRRYCDVELIGVSELP